jgi:hypothetical protein
MSDFENINNAVVRAAALGGPWASLNDGWQSDVVGPRAWKEAIPPLWSSLLESYWVLYAKLYAANPGQHGQLADPKTIVPGGLTAAVKELYAPITSAVQKTVQQKINAIEDAVNAKLRTISNQIGAEIAKGAQQQTYDWAWGLGGLAVGVGLLWLVLRGSGGRGAAVGLRGLEAGPDLYHRLISYLTQYDERQSKGKYHNRYAIGQYFQAAEPLKRLSDDPQKFAEALSKAFLPGFKPREVLLAAIADGGTGPIKLYGRVKKKSRELEADPTEAEQRAALTKVAERANAKVKEWYEARPLRTGGPPRLTADSSRKDLIAWLKWNDPNGGYSDADAEREGFDPLTKEDAWEQFNLIGF